jgi:hypothetical protein
VVVEGVTMSVVPVTAPTPEVMLTVWAPVTAQLSVLGCPGVTFAGVALKLAMAGRLPAATVTAAVLDPKELAAVRV